MHILLEYTAAIWPAQKKDLTAVSMRLFGHFQLKGRMDIAMRLS